MKLFDWIKGMFNKNKLIDAPKQEDRISPEEQFRKDMQAKAELSPEEIEIMQKEEERKRQIRVASYDVINTPNNLDKDEIRMFLGNKLLSLKMQQLGSIGSSDIKTNVVLTDFDLEILNHIHFAIQSNPEFSSYLNSIDKTTRDNNIVEVVNRMEAIAKEEAKNYGYVDGYATRFIPNASNIINQLKKEQQERDKWQLEQE